MFHARGRVSRERRLAREQVLRVKMQHLAPAKHRRLHCVDFPSMADTETVTFKACEICGQAIASLSDYVIINKPPNRLRELPLTFLAHGACCNKADPLGMTYRIELDSIVRDGVEGGNSMDTWRGWEFHLSRKPWVTDSVLHTLSVAHQYAVSVALLPCGGDHPSGESHAQWFRYVGGEKHAKLERLQCDGTLLVLGETHASSPEGLIPGRYCQHDFDHKVLYWEPDNPIVLDRIRLFEEKSETGGHYSVEIDGYKMNRTVIKDRVRGNPALWCRTPQESEILLDLDVALLWRKFSSIAVALGTNVGGFEWHAEAFTDAETVSRKLNFIVYSNLETWSRGFSYEAFAAALHVEADRRGVRARLGTATGSYESGGCAIETDWPDSCSNIGLAVRENIAMAEDIVIAAEKRAMADDAGAVTERFSFPSHIRTAAQQYLLYFVQFLADLGIDATAEIREHAHGILFSVTPTEGRDALSRIREALDVFLGLPGSETAAKLANETADIATMQLQANLMHLQAQVTLANAIIETKSATIQSLQLSQYQLQRQLIEHTEVRRLTPGGRDSSEQEELVGGVVALKEIETGPLVWKLPEIVRRLKRRK